MSTEYILGIDPGFSGAIAVMDNKTRELVLLQDMPVVKSKTKVRGKTKIRTVLDASELAFLIRGHSNSIKYCFLEKVHAMPGQGVTSMFNFGVGYGVIRGTLTTLGVRIIDLEPAVWKSLLGLGRDKNASRILAAKKFPKCANLFRQKRDEGRAEASLMAWLGGTRL